MTDHKPPSESSPNRRLRPGTVVEATVEVSGRITRRTFFRTVYEPNPWVAQQDVKDRSYYDDGDLDDVIVLYEPPFDPLAMRDV